MLLESAAVMNQKLNRVIGLNLRSTPGRHMVPQKEDKQCWLLPMSMQQQQ